MRTRLISIALLLGALTLSGCRQDMHDQPKYIPLRESTFFDDGRSSRTLVAGTVARGMLRDDEAFYLGKVGGKELEVFPIAIDKPVLERGQRDFNTFCSPCHGRIGNGLGMIVRRGFKQPPSYHIERLRNATPGYIYGVITNGYGAMWNYAAQIQPYDRWAIVAYVKALQYSQNADVKDLSAEARAHLPSPEVTDPNAPPAKGTKPSAERSAGPDTKGSL